MRRTLSLSLAVLLVTVIALGVARTQGPDLPPFAIPLDDRVLRTEVVLPDGKVAQVMVRNGTLMAIESKRLGATILGLAPALVNDKVAWLPLQIREGGHVQQLPPLKAPEFVGSTEPVIVNTEWGEFQLTVQNLTTRPFPLAAPLNPETLTPEERAEYGRYATTDKGRCCVFNKDWSLCASAVEFLGDSCETEAITELASRAQ